MRRIYFLLIVIIGGIGIFAVFRFRKLVVADIRPEVLNISTSQVTIAWLSEVPYKGTVFYKPVGSDVRPSEAMETFGASSQHEVVITGLKSSTRYTYWIGKSKSRFQFQTQPVPVSPFSFLMVTGSIGRQIVSLVTSEMPEFIISLTDINRQKDCFSEIRPYIPIYGHDGVDSPFLRTIEKGKTADSAGLWRLDWGGLRLIFAYGTGQMTTMLDAPAAHTLGVITSMIKIDKETIKQTKLHSILIAHNKQKPTGPVAFVAVVGESKEVAEIDGIQYFGIGVRGKKAESEYSIAVRVDVDVESSRAVFLDDGREVALKRPPLKEKRTCTECRRLADKGAYEESVKAYKEFIGSHQGHFQISDAYFAIASIYDEKLFKFIEALQWYNRLLNEYPKGTLAPLAKQRIKYLSTYCDYNYEPLVQFERIRKIEFARKKHSVEERNKVLVRVESIITEYPDSKSAPTMQYWLANQYRQSDPDKAVQAYQRLRDKYPNSPQAQEILIEIGETYYDAGRFREAIEVYTKGLGELPVHQETIKAQISRAERNIRRDKIALICWGVIIFITAVTILARPRGININRIGWSIAGFVVLELILLFGAWLIHEQFSSVAEMLLITIFFSAVASVGSLISISFAEKLIGKAAAKTTAARDILRAVVGSITGLSFQAAGIYLAIYYINLHYLIVVGM
jgi:tetratricopeptide (TPR) repeat protein